MDELIIQEIKHTKTKIYLILGNKEKIEVNTNTLLNFNLYEGKSLTKEVIKAIKCNSKEENNFDYVVSKLKNTTLTTGAIRKVLLKRNTSEKEIASIIKRLQNCNVLNEGEIIKEILEEADYKHYGFNKIVHKLISKGISNALIKNIEYDEIRETKQAILLADQTKRKYESKNDFQMRHSIYETLLRNGFSSELSLEIVNKIPNSNKNHEINVLKLEYIKLYGKYSKQLEGKNLKDKIITSLLAKGFKKEDIKNVEDLNDEMD